MSHVTRANVRKAVAALYGLGVAWIVHLVGPTFAPPVLAVIGFAATVLIGSTLTWAESRWSWVGKLLVFAGLPTYPPRPKFVLPSSEVVDKVVSDVAAAVAPAAGEAPQAPVQPAVEANPPTTPAA